MNKKHSVKRIYWIVSLISILLIVKVFIAYNNSLVIDENVRIQKEAEKIKVNTLDIIRTLHLLDLGIRGYAIVRNEQIGAAYDSALIRKEVVLKSLERSLLKQKFEMGHFNTLQDSVNSYFNVAKTMMEYLKAGDRKNFEIIFKTDPGYQIWLDYKRFSEEINAFEDSILEKSQINYEHALRLDYLLLIFLLVLIIPTLFFTAFQTTKTFSALKKLKESETEKNQLLATQNETLERLVKERTEEIETQNEEIRSQYEEISTHNEMLAKQQDEISKHSIRLEAQNQELTEAKKLIENQNEIINQSNLRLTEEVQHQTKNLVETNKELARHVSQLEQFAYIVSHNLRAPVARILGLGTVISTMNDITEIKKIVGHLSQSSQELDGIFHDLNLILHIKELGDESNQSVDLLKTIQRIKNMLEPELNNKTTIDDQLISATQLRTIPAYLESILYNLISNAIKYRSDKRSLVIKIISRYEAEHIIITVQDNGSGIDLTKHEAHLFKPYKRFHKNGEGKGLGLFLVKTQTDLLGGEILVDSKVDEGCVFTLRLKHGTN